MPERPRFLLRGSPLVAGGKARLMSNRKVKPGPAQPREVTGPEESGYTEQARRALLDAGEALTEEDWKTFVRDRAKLAKGQQRTLEEVQREQTRRLMSFEERLKTARVEARNRRIDVSSEVRLLSHMQARGKDVRHLEQRLGVIERKVWREEAA